MASIWSWDLSFLLLLRMIDEKSAPIRPPSYMPATHLQWFGLWKSRGGAVHELETELGLTHHSNGQQQCPFVPQGLQNDPGPDTCLTGPALHRPLRRNVNYRSGDFSTSYSTAGLHYAFMTLDADRYLSARGSLGVIFEHHFVVDRGLFGGFPGAIDHDQAALYGIHRVRFEGQGRLHLGPPESPLAGVLSASGSHELMWNTGPSIPNNRTLAEVSYTVDGFHGLGLFVRGSTGQDRLNILYAAGRANVLTLGLIWSTSPALRYRFGEGEPAGE